MNSSNNKHNSKHNKGDTINVTKVVETKSTLMQITKDNRISVNSQLYDIPVRKQDMYFQPLVFGSGVLLTGKVVEELAAYFQLK